MSSPSAGWFWPSCSSAHVMFGSRVSLICGACRSEQLRSRAVPQDYVSAVVERCAANTGCGFESHIHMQSHNHSSRIFRYQHWRQHHISGVLRVLSYRRYEVFELILPFFANDINFVCLSILSSKKAHCKKNP